MRRVPEVLDCWFESGSMPFAQVHYPFENAEWFEQPLPGRLHRRVHRADPRLVLHHARAGHRAVRPAGVPQLPQPRHPARRRRPQDVQEPAQLPGRLPGVRRVRLRRDALDADVLAGAARRRHAGHRGRRSATPYGRCCCRCGTSGTSSPSTPTPRATRRRGRRRPDIDRTLLDRYVLAKTGELVADGAARSWTRTTSPGACGIVRSFLDALTNWYVRRSRDRFWSGDRRTPSTRSHTVLETLCRVMAPLAPLTTEEIWRGLTGGRSVHLTDWPPADEFPADHELVAAMDATREVCSAALSLRKAQGSAGAAAAAEADRGHAGWRRSCVPSPTWSPTRSTSRRSSSPTTWRPTASRC